MDEPLVSIVVPCYNADETLERTLDSVLKQDYDNYEVVLVDDGSSDATPDVIRSYEERDSRFRSIRQKNSGVSVARNAGVEAAKGELIAFLDADDLFYENALADRVKVIIEDGDPEMIGAYCPAEMVLKDGSSMGLPLLFNYSLPNDRLYFLYTPNCVFTPTCVVLKKSKFVEVGGFDKSIAPAEDYLMWHRMMRMGGYFKVVKKCRIGYTQHPESAVRSKLLKHYKQWKKAANEICFEAPDLISEFKAGFGDSIYLRELSNRAFSTTAMALAVKQHEVAREISQDINRFAIEMTTPAILEYKIKFNVLRALCKKESEWISVVWPDVREDIVGFVDELNDRFGGNSSSLLSLRARLEKMGGRNQMFSVSIHEVHSFVSRAFDLLGQDPKLKKIFYLVALACSVGIALLAVVATLIIVRFT